MARKFCVLAVLVAACGSSSNSSKSFGSTGGPSPGPTGAFETGTGSTTSGNDDSLTGALAFTVGTGAATLTATTMTVELSDDSSGSCLPSDVVRDVFVQIPLDGGAPMLGTYSLDSGATVNFSDQASALSLVATRALVTIYEADSQFVGGNFDAEFPLDGGSSELSGIFRVQECN